MANKALAAKLGIQPVIPITDAVRQPGCDASFAEFSGLEKGHALYIGECSCRHHYEIRMLLKDVQVSNTISVQANGSVGIGTGKGYKLHDLGEY